MKPLNKLNKVFWCSLKFFQVLFSSCENTFLIKTIYFAAILCLEKSFSNTCMLKSSFRLSLFVKLEFKSDTRTCRISPIVFSCNFTSYAISNARIFTDIEAENSFPWAKFEINPRVLLQLPRADPLFQRDCRVMFFYGTSSCASWLGSGQLCWCQGVGGIIYW